MSPRAGILASSFATTLKYETESDTPMELDGASLEACKDSCKNNDQMTQSIQTEDSGVMNGDTSGGQQEINECERFCEQKLGGSKCFPGDSTVQVRGRGRVNLTQLRLGDEVLTVAPCWPRQGCETTEDGLTLRYEPTLAWLHRAPSQNAEMLRISHGLGEVNLSGDHLIFVRHHDSSQVVAVFAREVIPGDRVLTPWLDGSFAAPEVLSVERRIVRGLFAPLVASGVLLVDCTVVSCYAVPRLLVAKPLTSCISAVAHISSTPFLIDSWHDGDTACADSTAVHKVAHALLSPVRLLAAASGSSWFNVVKAPSDALESKLSNGMPGAEVHPYCLALYMLAQSLMP